MKRIFFGWWIVTAAAAGLAFSPGPVAFYSLGVFMEPLMEQFGWAKADVAFAATILTISIIATTPLIGFLVDKFGPKRVLLLSMIAFGGGLSSVALVESVTGFYLAYACIGIGGAGANSMAYMKLLSAWFDRKRGLVIGIASAGMGFGFTIVPMLTEAAITHYGYRGAYIVLATVIVLICAPLVAVIVRNDPAQMNLLPDGVPTVSSREPAESSGLQGGFTLRQAARMKQFWILLLVFFPVGGVIYAIAVHLVSIVSEIAASRETAIRAATLLGFAMMFGRVAAGMLFDRLFAPYVLSAVFFSAAIGAGIFITEPHHFWVYAASMLIGFCSGAEGDALAYLVSRYFGLRSFGKVYGYVFSAVMLGISVFPYLLALDYDRTGNYHRSLIACVVAFSVSAMLLFALGRYPDLGKVGPRA
jgi:MFS family permease